MVKQNPDLIGSRTFEIVDNSLKCSTTTADFTYDTHYIINIEETTEYFYLFSGTTSAIILPKRAFANTDESGRLKKLITVSR